MGTWAEGNFDDDAARDYLGDVIDSFVKRVEKIFKDENRVRLDEEGESVLIPTVEIVAVLCEHCKGVPPKEKRVMDWQAKYLKVFDEQIDGLDPDED